MATSGNPIEKLTPDQVQAVAALLSSKDIKTAAAKSGCGETTLHRWLREDADFKAALQAAEAELIDQAVRMLAGGAGDAIGVLVAIMNNKKVNHGVRVRAAKVVIDQLVKLREYSELEERIAALEDFKNATTGI
jgi:hypothetical protein